MRSRSAFWVQRAQGAWELAATANAGFHKFTNVQSKAFLILLLFKRLPNNGMTLTVITERSYWTTLNIKCTALVAMLMVVCNLWHDCIVLGSVTVEHCFSFAFLHYLSFGTMVCLLHCNRCLCCKFIQNFIFIYTHKHVVNAWLVTMSITKYFWLIYTVPVY